MTMQMNYLYRILSQFYEVEVFTDGELQQPRASTPDLVLSDVMPGMDGFELLRQLRADLKPRDSNFAVLCWRRIGS